MPALKISPNNAIEAAISSLFLERLNEIESAGTPNLLTSYEQLCTVERLTGTNSASMSWLGAVPPARRFEGEREFAQLRAGTFRIELTPYEASITLPREAFQSYLSDGIRAKIRSLADELVRFKTRSAVRALATGATLTAYDNDPLLSSTRGNLTSSALSLDAVQAGIAAMGQFKTEFGVSLQKRPTHLLVGPKLQLLASQITGSSTIVVRGTGNDVFGSLNPVAGTLQVLVSYDLIDAYDDYWFLLDLDGVRPIVAGIRSDVPDELVIHSDPNVSSTVFTYNQVVAGITSYFGVAAGDPYSVYAGIL